MTDDVLRFALVTFERVFDTDPVQEALTLQELTHALRRFEVRAKLQRRVVRELQRIEALHRRFLDGDEVVGRQGSKIRRTAEEAQQQGADVNEAVAARVQEMKGDVSKQSKKELRIWSPALYVEDPPKRGGDHVTHVSCLVLDYDDGSTMARASEVWSNWYHVVHSTWSHTEALHKFRLILPLARPVPAPQWRDVWKWAEEYAGCVIDPACKSPASTYALPAVANDDWPRVAFTHAGSLLDPVFEGLVPESPPPPPVVVSPTAYMIDGDPEAVYIVHQDPAPAASPDDDDDEMWDLWSDGEQETLTGDEPASTEARLEALERRMNDVVARLDAGDTVSDLERLEALRERGVITDEEYEAVKARIL